MPIILSALLLELTCSVDRDWRWVPMRMSGTLKGTN